MLFKKTKTVDGVLAGFQQIVADLEEIRDANQAKVVHCNDEIHRLQGERREYLDEAERANTAAGNITRLLS